MIETVGFISQGLAAFGDVELWLGAALLLGTGAGLWRVLKPATATVPNINITAPPNTEVGIANSTPPTKGNNPATIRIAAIKYPT